MDLGEEEFLPEGIGSDIEDHAISSSDDDGDGTPRMTPDQIPEFDPEQDIGSLLAQGDEDEEAAGPSYLTSSFLSMPENVSQKDLHVKKAPGAKDAATPATAKGGKKRTKRKAPKEGKDNEPKKKKKKSKKEGGKKKEKKGKNKEVVVTPGEKNKRRNIKTFLQQHELEEETVNAQREEEERKKRLEEQRALNSELATLSELLSDVPSTQPTPPSPKLPSPPPLQQSPQSTHSSRTFPPPLGSHSRMFPPLQSTYPPSPSSSPLFPPLGLRPPPPSPHMPLPIPNLTPAIQSQMMKSFPSQFRVFNMAHQQQQHPMHSMHHLMQGSMPPKPPPKTAEDGCIVLDDSSGEDDDASQQKKSKEDVICISSGDEDVVTLVSDADSKEDEPPVPAEEDDEDYDEESSGMHTNDKLNVPDAYGRVLVNINHPPDEPDIFLPDHLSRTLKPHQIGGIRFLYDNLIESMNRYSQSAGFGCILAHSMGLGKTIQLVTFTDIYMRYTGAKTILCIVPINTLQNWLAEFDMWLPTNGIPRDVTGDGDKEEKKRTNGAQSSECDDRDNEEGDDDKSKGESAERPSLRTFRLFVLNDMHKTTDARLSVIDEWYNEGGVLLMGYEMYRLLCSKKIQRMRRKAPPKPSRKKAQVIDLEEEDRKEGMMMDIRRALVKPGPDLVICDEGHRIKNSLAGISQALKNIRTRRRVVLTGYPLQNNLQEYWCMVDFVRPNFLGTKHEFSNLFERPISNGQCLDSTPNDMRLMKHRAHVLHKVLEGFVQRRGFAVLRSALPPKEEHVLLVRLTPFQRGLYIRFMQRFQEAGAAGWCSTNPLKAFSVACKIWNHPDVLCDVLQTNKTLDTDADLELPDFNTKKPGRKKGANKDPASNGRSGGDDSGKSSPSAEMLAAGGASCSSKPPIPESYVDRVNEILSFEWARDLMKNYQQNKISNSSKMVLLFSIIEESMKKGDKLLVFSQSLMTLSVIEKFLSLTPVPQPVENPPEDMPQRWVRNESYFRLDGSTPVSEREKMINQFNRKDSNKFWLFLLSTRAGSLGINLIGANRVVVLDASWNPCHDAQAVCRVYRYGQKKRCHVYRMVTDNTLEKKIYDRQISKKGMSDRVVDEMNPEMNLTKKEVESLLEFDESDMPYEDFSHDADKFTDGILINLCKEYSNNLSKTPFTTESLLCDRRDRRLTRAEKRQAESNYEAEKKLNLSYSRPSYTQYYGQGASAASRQRLNIGANAAHASALPSSFMSRYTANRPVANVRPIQSTPVPKTPMNNMQQRLVDLRNAGVTVQKIVATTDIILPGTATLTNTTPLIKAGEQVTFIKTQKGVYLRTTDGRILAVRGAAQGGNQGRPSGLEQSLEASFSSSSQMPSNTVTTASGMGSIPSAGLNTSSRHQLADLLSEKVSHTSSDPINLSSDSEAENDFFDPFRSPSKMPRHLVGSQGSPSTTNRQDGGSDKSGLTFPGPSGTKPATCTVSPGVQSVPLASTLPLGPFGQSRQSGGSSQQESSSSPLAREGNSPSLTSRSSTPTNSSSATPVRQTELNQLLGLPSSGSGDAPVSDSLVTSGNQTMPNPTTPLSSMANTNIPQQQAMQQTQSNYGMPFFPGMVPMPSTGGNPQGQQSQQPPIVINYQLPMPPGTMMPSGAFVPFGYPPMMFPGAAAGQSVPTSPAQTQGQLPQQPHSMLGQNGQAPSSGGSRQVPSSGIAADPQEQGKVQEPSLGDILDQMEQEQSNETSDGSLVSAADADRINLPLTEAVLLTQKMREATSAAGDTSLGQ